MTYNSKMERLTSEVSNQITGISLRIDEFYSQLEKISSRADEVVDAIKRR